MDYTTKEVVQALWCNNCNNSAVVLYEKTTREITCPLCDAPMTTLCKNYSVDYAGTILSRMYND